MHQIGFAESVGTEFPTFVEPAETEFIKVELCQGKGHTNSPEFPKLKFPKMNLLHLRKLNSAN